jgi:hypothetical protein
MEHVVGKVMLTTQQCARLHTIHNTNMGMDLIMNVSLWTNTSHSHVAKKATTSVVALLLGGNVWRLCATTQKAIVTVAVLGLRMKQIQLPRTPSQVLVVILKSMALLNADMLLFHGVTIMLVTSTDVS